MKPDLRQTCPIKQQISKHLSKFRSHQVKQNRHDGKYNNNKVCQENKYIQRNRK